MTVGATPGLPAAEVEIAAAELRLGVRFDAQYRELMTICSGIEALGDAFLYPADELGMSARWLDWAGFLEIDYFSREPTFETRGEETIDPIFHPPPAGRSHVLIGEKEIVPSSLVCNFAVSDPNAPAGDIADCRYEPDILGDLPQTLTHLIENAEEYTATSDESAEPAESARAQSRSQVGRLLHGITVQNRARIRHALSSRWRTEFDRQPGQAGLNSLRAAVFWAGAREPTIDYNVSEFNLRDPCNFSIRTTVHAPDGWVKTSSEIVIGLVKENTVWRIDSWSQTPQI